VAGAVAEAEVTADMSGRRVTFAIDVAPADLAASVDRARLHQVLINLLDNAARHSPPQGTVTVLARPEGEQLMIEVHDQGPGIAAADRERVFHRFTRGERPVGGGTGLGLAIARWAVELHGGRIAVVQSPDLQPSSRYPGHGSGGAGVTTLPTRAAAACPPLSRRTRTGSGPAQWDLAREPAGGGVRRAQERPAGPAGGVEPAGSR
jgi:signal transduction histidine kinase